MLKVDQFTVESEWVVILKFPFLRRIIQSSDSILPNLFCRERGYQFPSRGLDFDDPKVKLVFVVCLEVQWLFPVKYCELKPRIKLLHTS